MPHILVDYSNNLSDDELDINGLLDVLVATATSTDVFPETGMRARAFKADAQRVATGDPMNAYINVSMRVGPGRDVESRKEAGQAIFDTLKAFTEELMTKRKVLLSFEMRELDPVRFNFKNT